MAVTMTCAMRRVKFTLGDKKGALELLGLIVVAFATTLAHAEIVVPRDSVTSYVNIRAHADGNSQEIGQLAPGQQLTYSRSIPRWHVVVMPDGSDGFVSKRWTEVLPDPLPLSQGIVVHFLDVGTGDSAIIDMGDKEIIIDGGDSIAVLDRYVRRAGVIQDPIELVVVTHGDTDHWNGLRRLLGFDDVVDRPLSVSEYWDPGYNRDCNPPAQGGRVNYLKFVDNLETLVPAASFRRPLSDFHAPASVDAPPQPVFVSSLPGVRFTVLHADKAPDQGSCSYKINNASIVLSIELSGFRFLFTGDANGKERDEPPPGTPGHVEAKLLALEAAHTGILKADVLKVPHHGSETASTQQFIDVVDPDFAIVSASTKHHLPKSTVITRYENGERVVLRTDVHPENDIDHILCRITSDGSENALDCNYSTVLNE